LFLILIYRGISLNDEKVVQTFLKLFSPQIKKDKTEVTLQLFQIQYNVNLKMPFGIISKNLNNS